MSKWGEAISEKLLEDLYLTQGLSAQEIADKLGISHHKVIYWMDKYGIQRRERSEASYLKHNPDGEKFSIDISNRDLFIAGIALYMGEGGKTDTSRLDLTNSDPRILKLWVQFLKEVCNGRRIAFMPTLITMRMWITQLFLRFGLNDLRYR